MKINHNLSTHSPIHSFRISIRKEKKWKLLDSGCAGNCLEKLSVSASGIWYSGADTNGKLKRILATDEWDDLKTKLNNLIGYPHHN